MTAFHSGSISQIGNAAFYTEAIKIASENHLSGETFETKVTTDAFLQVSQYEKGSDQNFYGPQK